MAKGQRARKPKTSKGVHGSGGKGRRLTDLELIHMGKGMFKTVPIIGGKRYTALASREPFDAEQARKNRILYPHLFSSYAD
jgi:hypothetical protein